MVAKGDCSAPCRPYARRRTRGAYACSWGKITAALVAFLLGAAPAASASDVLRAELQRRSAARELAQQVLERGFEEQRPHVLAACSLFRDEAPYLLEWVLWHYLSGVQHFHLFDNGSSDGSRAALQALVDRGLVTYHSWPGPKRAAQQAQLDHCFNGSVASEWVVSHDLDEFLVLPSEDTDRPLLLRHRVPLLHELLRRYRAAGVGAVMLNRLHFGSQPHREHPQGELAVTSYLFRLMFLEAPRQDALLGKPILLREAVIAAVGAHEVDLRSGWACTNALRQPCNTSSFAYEPVRINHYVTRSHAECLAKAGNNNSAQASNWRLEVGATFCAMFWPGSPGYYREEHVRDELAARSMQALVVQSLIKHLRPSPAAVGAHDAVDTTAADKRSGRA